MENNNVVDGKIEKIYEKISSHEYSTKVLYTCFSDLDYYVIKALEECSSKHGEQELYSKIKMVDQLIINDKMDAFEASYIKDETDFYMDSLTPSYKVALRNEYCNIKSDDNKRNNEDYINILNTYITRDEVLEAVYNKSK